MEIKKLSDKAKASILLLFYPNEDLGSVLDKIDEHHTERLKAGMDYYETFPNVDELKDGVYEEFLEVLQLIKHERAIAAGLFEDQNLNVAPVEEDEPDVEPIETDDPLEDILKFTSEQLHMALHDENPRTIAIVLHMVQPEKVADVLKKLPMDTRLKVFNEMSNGVPRNEALIRRLVGAVVHARAEQERAPAGSGTSMDKRMADVLQILERDEREEIMKSLHEANPDAAVRIDDMLFNFEDVLEISDQTMFKILSEPELNEKMLARALYGAPQTVVGKILKNRSTNVAAMIKEEMDLQPALAPERVREARRAVVDVIRRYERDGDLVWNDQREQV